MDFDYFNRLWCSQEITAAISNELKMSQQRFSITEFSKGLEVLRLLALMMAEVIPGTETFGFPKLEDQGDTLFLRRYFHDGEELDLDMLIKLVNTSFLLYSDPACTAEDMAAKAHTLFMNRRRVCADPRDHVFALRFSLGLGTEYPVDYSLTAAQVFADYIIFYMRNTASLDILSYPCRKLSWRPGNLSGETASWTPDLPSWCPDLAISNKGGRKLVALAGPNESYKGRSLVRMAAWNAGGSRTQFTQISRQVLGLRGLRICTIRECGPDIGFWIMSPPSTMLLQRFIMRSAHHVPASGLYKLFLDVATAGADLTRDASLRHLTKHLRGSKQKSSAIERLGPVWLARCMPALFRMAGFSVDSTLTTVDEGLILDSFNTLMLKAGEAPGNSLRFFTTDSETFFLGNGPDGMLEGDRICVLFGGRVPFIVRPVNDRYFFIGECYVSNLMHGRALSMGLKEEEFVFI